MRFCVFVLIYALCGPYFVAPTAAQAPEASGGSAVTTAQLERKLYFRTMNLIEREYALSHMNRVVELLEDTRKNPNRGFEWGYWNAMSRQQKVTFPAAAAGIHSGITALAFSPDGKSLLTATGGDRKILVRDSTSGVVTHTAETDSPFGCASFSADGRQVVTVQGYVVAVRQTDTGATITKTDRAMGAVAAKFLPGGKSFVTAGLDGWGQAFDCMGGAGLFRAKDRAIGSLYSISVSPDGKYFGSGDDGNCAWIWSTANGATRQQLKGHKGAVWSEAFSPDGKQFATGSFDCDVRIWDVDTGSVLQVLRGHTGVITCICYSTDSNRIYTASVDGAVKIWDAHTGALLRDLRGHTRGIHAMALSPDGSTLATGSDEGDILLWDASGVAPLGSAPVNEGMIRFNNMQHSKAPFRLFGIGVKIPPLSWDGMLAVVPKDTTAEVWQITTGKKLSILKGNGSPVTHVAFSRDKKLIATATHFNTVELWDAGTGALLHELTGPAGPALTLCFSEDGASIVSGGDDHTAFVWNTTSGKQICRFTGHTGSITEAKFQCGDRLVVTGSKDGYACIWDVKSGHEICRLAGMADAVYGLLISPDKRRILTDNRTLTLWDGTTGKKVSDLDIRASDARYAFSPNGSRVVVGSLGGYVRMFETGRGEDVLTLNIGGAGNWATDVAFADGGKRLDIHNGAVPPVSFRAQY